MKVCLGISAFYHNSAAALVATNGRVLYAAEEERFSRRKNDSQFPLQAIAAGLRHCGIAMQEVETVVFYEDPYLKAARVMESLRNHDSDPRTAGIRKALSDFVLHKLCVRQTIKSLIDQHFATDYDLERISYIRHHEAHAASAFFTSPFRSTDVLCVDAVGECDTTTFWSGQDASLRRLHSIGYPHSLGLFYSTITAFLGFTVNQGEYKVMGMAAYGRPRFLNALLDNVISIDPQAGSIALNMSMFEFEFGTRMYSDKLARTLGMSPRLPTETITSDHIDLACSAQRIAESAVLAFCSYMHNRTGTENLAMAGGVALNCVANARVTADTGYKHLWVMPAAGDAGCAVGAACWGATSLLNCTGSGCRFDLGNMYLGPQLSAQGIRTFLDERNVSYERLPDATLFSNIACALAEGKTVGWVSGRMEFGPRALGNRSILADPCSPTMQNRLNHAVKRRESFRPFAPVVKEEQFSDWFCGEPNRHMTSVAHVKQRPDSTSRGVSFAGQEFAVESLLSATTHVDGTARVQTVSKCDNPRLYALLDAFESITGVPILLNTSFNTANMPIVCNEQHAWDCFINSGIDLLCLENYVVTRSALS